MPTTRTTFSSWDAVTAAIDGEAGRAFADDVSGVVTEVWSSITGDALQHTDVSAAVDADAKKWMTSITVAGPWRAAFVISCGEDVTRALAGAMFGVEPADATNEEITDALGEVANMIGGQAKPLISSSGVLGLPTVVAGNDCEISVAGLHAIVTRQFAASGSTVTLEVLGGPAPA